MLSQNAGSYLRQLMQKSCVCMPGAFNPLVGRICADTGFNACYVSGGALSASNGVPDIGLIPIDTFTKLIKDIGITSGLPVFADADTGFGEIEMVSRTIYEFNSAGAAGLHIEDQVFPKKCGHLEGKELVSTEEFCEKIKAAINARNKCSGTNGLLVCARTDAAAVEGLTSAISRAKQYCQAGADMIFPEGLKSEDEFEIFSREMKKLKGEAPGGGPYLLANMTEFGKTVPISMNTFEKIGYHAVIFPVSTLRVSMKATETFLKTLKAKQIVDYDLQKTMFTRKELYDTLHYDPAREWIFPSSSKPSN